MTNRTERTFRRRFATLDADRAKDLLVEAARLYREPFTLWSAVLDGRVHFVIRATSDPVTGSGWFPIIRDCTVDDIRPEGGIPMISTWIKKHPRATPEMLGFIPEFLSEADPRPVREQLDANYGHGGGWRPFKGHEMLPNGDLSYPGDPPTRLLYETHLRDETIRIYEHAWVAVIQRDGSFEISRLD